MPGKIQSIERAAAILRLLSGRSGALGVVEIASELGLPKGTVHGLLKTMVDVGFVRQDPATGKYLLGVALLHMGFSYLDGNELRARALNWSDSLASRTHESVRIGMLHEKKVLIVHHVFRPDNTLQTLDIGALMPAHATAIGKILLAAHPHTTDELISAGLQAYTDATITDGKALRRELTRVRDRGWAFEAGELEPMRGSIAAPIIDRGGRTVGGMGIFGSPERLFTARLPRHDLLTYVREHARAVSQELGAIPW